MDGERFDSMTRIVATAATRRRLLEGLAGSLVALVGGQQVTRAQNGGNSACAHYCREVLPAGRERGECTSQAAHGAGLCFECGPAAPACPPPKVRRSLTSPCPCVCPEPCAPGFVQDPATCVCRPICGGSCGVFGPFCGPGCRCSGSPGGTCIPIAG